jgi:tRNA modification GTPase
MIPTIIAPASGALPAGVCVVRASGPAAGRVLDELAGGRPPPRRAVLRGVRDRAGGLIDRALILWFPAPASFTGEDCAEVHLHGGKAVVEAFLTAALTIEGVALAPPGGFTRRAFDNGRMDLSAAEGLADLIEAETEAQRLQAVRQMDGALGRAADAWRDTLIDALAEAEADIDFPDEDLPPGLGTRARRRIETLADTLRAHLAASEAARHVRDGLRVAIIGPPNAGKSSLLNALAGREAAIVSPIPGTTRDVVEVRLNLDGALVWVADTAGLREAADQIEAEGVRRALARAEEADLRVALVDDPADAEKVKPLIQKGDLMVLSKADRDERATPDGFDLAVSTKTGRGLSDLLRVLSDRAAAAAAQSVAAPLTRLRHVEAVRDALDALSRALHAPGEAGELIAEDLRLAARALGRITGRVDVENVLDRLFGQFCIGK